ncbi:MAG: SLBB domain-containing protein [Gammaproteobacteria bacterium]|nr:SLBB domain-containing protein [Gammaproteobacteria bacterium]
MLAAVLLLLLASERSHAQGFTPTPEQLQIFQGLTPEQQDAILKQLGNVGGTGGTGTGLSSGGSNAERTGANEKLPGAEINATEAPPPDEESEPLTPQLRGEDWVVLEVDFHLQPRAPASAPGQTPAAAAPVDPAALAAAGSPAAAAESPSATPAGEMAEADRTRLEQTMAAIRARNPYQLSHEGALTLPGFRPIALLGLSEEQATLRLKVEPALRGLDIRLTRLPLKKTGVEGLKPFGYSLFDHRLSTFAPVTNVPVPADYLLGPGDELAVQLYGNQNRTLRLTVGRDGVVSFPGIGPLNVGGQTFRAAKADIEARVERQMIGVRASVSMGDLGAIRVFVLGEARRPGSYTVSPLSTMTSALYAAGGIKPIGSLRNVLLKRHGALVRSLDLYNLLLRGDSSDDAKIQQGDVIFIPPVGATVSVDGEVRRPAIYEVRGETTVAEVLQLAGGLTPEADGTKAVVTRIDAQQRRVVTDVDLAAGARGELVHNGDLLRILRLRPTLDAAVVVQGFVYTPGTFAYRKGLHLSDVIRSVEELRPDADQHYVLIRRELPPDRRITVLSADLAAALRAPGSPADIELMPRDRITVFDLASARDQVIQPLLEELRLQGSSRSPTELVHIDGQVKVPGEYPLEPGMRISDLVRAGGGTAESAYGKEAELTRYQVAADQSRRTELIPIDLGAALRGEPSANIELQPFDRLTVKEVPLWEAQESIAVRGEVRFPGVYSIRRGETLHSVLARAGGLTDFAFPEGSVFTRESLRKQEQQQIDLLAERTQRDLTMLALQAIAVPQAQGAIASGGPAALAVGQSLLGQLRTAKAVGRLVIDLPAIMRTAPGSAADVILRGGDQLIVPRKQQQVMVLGEVQYATSHLYNPRLGRDDYIALSGGTTRRADKGRIYVVRANGSVVAQEGSRWFQHHGQTAIKPGDTVVVPLDTERIPPLPFWQAVTQILYNVAIAAAAVHAL